MKPTTFLILLLITFSGIAQQKQDPEIYLNLVKIDLNKVYLNGLLVESEEPTFQVVL